MTRVGTWRRAYVSGGGVCVPRYGMIVPLLVPLQDEMFGLGSGPYPIRFRPTVVAIAGKLGLQVHS